MLRLGLLRLDGVEAAPRGSQIAEATFTEFMGVEVEERAHMSIGREDGCDLKLDSDAHSHAGRKHAQLRRTGDLLFLEDNVSTNGTYVNGNRIHEEQEVQVGDELRFGKATQHHAWFRVVEIV